MISKISQDVAQAVSRIGNDSTVLIGGFGEAGLPNELIDALLALGPTGLTLVSNNAGNAESGVAALLKAGCVRKIVCSFPRQHDSYVFDSLWRSKLLELELVPQGTLAERLRAAGAGIAGFYTRTGAGTDLAKGKETRMINGYEHVLETPLHADFALIRAWRGDRWGNLTYRKTSRNFGPVMATAARHTIAMVDDIVPLGDLDPEAIATPGIYVGQVVRRPVAATEAA